MGVVGCEKCGVGSRFGGGDNFLGWSVLLISLEMFCVSGMGGKMGGFEHGACSLYFYGLYKNF